MTAAESGEHRADRVKRHPHQRCRQRSAGGIRNVVAGAASERERHCRDRAEIVGFVAVVQQQMPIANGAARHVHRIRRQRFVIGREPRDPRRACRAKVAQQWILGIEYQPAFIRNRACDRQFHRRQIFDRMDAVFAEMIGADIGDHRNIGLRQRQTAPQQATACGFQHRRFDIGAPQQLAGTSRA
jgi:hypothetical protein